MGSAIFCILFIFAFSTSLLTVNAFDSEVDEESPFAYEETKPNGPQNWGNLNPKWQVCSTGKLQSPIDLLHERVTVVKSLRELKRNYKAAPAALINRGHDIMMEWKADAGGIKINGTKYKLKQCHWHSPSEHTVNGASYDMELHMVHNSPRGEIAVIAILYKFGHPDTFISKFLHLVKTVDHRGLDLGVVNPWEIKFGSRKYYRYLGSLTVPPCTQGVIWTVLKKVRTVSREQARALRDAVHDGFEDNARPVQQWDGRTVYMYNPKSP
ncbi:Alpha carbonic anhydrase 4 [Abeliophyllum distichum]|uniref:Carbonic anhydrase n=1 Tax=Abeliophyllum distichum TaxID=126358 RepID=A0ABD1PPY8_9LAMI